MKLKATSGNLPITSENVKIAQYFIIGLVAFIILRRWLRKIQEDQAYKNTSNDPNTALAIQVRQACNPSGIDWMVEFDGTWSNDLMIVADQISSLDKVAAAYNTLYNESMFKRLEKELNATEFQEWMRRANAAPTTTNGGNYSAPVTLYAIRDTNVFFETDSSKVARTVKANETIGTRLKAYYITDSKGSKKLYYLVSWTWMYFFSSRGFVLASDTKIA